ncbi:MAG TPA: ABC transporter permease [Chitinophaga sp.]|uniref:ABC transporter permease n=1 Tax=Chitinophaga sp. TaxID=1869181 RepID=UPI002BE051C7|nr:ABC transporter permease [Chitinophaga sp.]HVI46678.1 ABC transporter permease [Chitinophaga sp.]
MMNFSAFIRGFRTKKIFTVLNIAGLSVGVAVSLLVFVFIRNELSIDAFHSKRDRIYRVVSTETFRDGSVDYDGCAPKPLADALKNEFPQAEHVSAVYRFGQQQFTIRGDGGAEARYKVKEAFYTEPALFHIFDFRWIAGDPETALKEPYTAVVTRATAASWFGRWEDAVGKTILQGDQRLAYRITGVLEDLPDNTDIPLKVVLSFATLKAWWPRDFTNPMSWDSFNSASQCFFTVKEGQHISSMNALLPGFVARHYTPLAAMSDTRDSSYFQPLREMHFDDRFYRYGDHGWTFKELWSIALIGIFMLLVACINFINLSTAQSLTRAKEVGVIKVLGGSRLQLFIRFMMETALLVAVALMLGYVLAAAALPWLQQLLEKPVNAGVFLTPVLPVFTLGLGMTMTFLAGVYPAVVLSGFKPVMALKKRLNEKTAGGLSLRRSLIVLQFMIAQLLIIATIVVTQQVRYIHSRPMGFDKDAVVLLDLPYNKDPVSRNDYIKNRMQQVPGVISASLCSEAPSSISVTSGYFTFENHPQPEDFEIIRRCADEDFLKTFHIKLAAGHYPVNIDTAINEIAVNECTTRKLGFKQPGDIIGRKIRLGNIQEPAITIVGVVKDFNTTSLKSGMSPMYLLPDKRTYSTIAIKVDPYKLRETVAGLRSVYNEVLPAALFDPVFFDDTIAAFYKGEVITSRLIKIFAILAVFISCLGMYGLISFMVMQKTKEVGIRKVLGASVQHILYLFSKEFTILIGVAFLVSAPVGYYFMQHWLREYHYHISIGWEVFGLTVLLSVIIAWTSIGYKVIKAALTNPARSMRTE